MIARHVCADTKGRGCFEPKPETEFTTRGLNRDGTVRRALLCKPCQARVQAEWEEANPEKVRGIRRRTYTRHRAKILHDVAEYERTHRDQVNAARRARYARDPEFRHRARKRQQRWRNQRRREGGESPASDSPTRLMEDGPPSGGPLGFSR
jgi:hypothetical protein